jgi:uncharacterized protein YjdB
MAHTLSRAPFALLLLGLAAACGVQGDEGPTSVRPSGVARITVSPNSQVTQVGMRVQLAATAYDPSGREVQDIEFEWSTSNPDIAVVDGGGSVLTRESGWVGIKASAAGAAGTALLAVEAR